MKKLLLVVMLFAFPPAIAQEGEPSDGVYDVLGKDVTPPRIKKQVDPEYPEKARKDRIQGVVKLRCVVNTEGLATNIEVVESMGPDFDNSAAVAIQRWRFTPGKHKGVTVPVRVRIEIGFWLDHLPGRR